MSPSRHFGNFELATLNDEPELLGIGSFGKTYRGHHRFLNTEVAIKIIRRRYSDNEEYKKTFLREARLVAQLSDPHIVRILDFGEQDGRLYYVMDYCDGGTLTELVKRPQDVTDSLVIEIACQATRALACAHRQGIIHRDIKPENIMLDHSDEPGALHVKLIDFGLAQPVASVTGFEEARAEGFHGTPVFASPEQIREEPLDGRSDLFSLGMSLWWLALGGQLPFGTEKETLTERLSPDSYQQKLHETLSPDLAILLGGLLEKNAQSRHASADHFLALLNDSFPAQIIPASQPQESRPEPDPVTARPRSESPEQVYQIIRKISPNGPGAYYEALRLADQTPLWLWLADHSADWRAELERHIALLQSHQPAGVSIPLDYEEFPDGTLAYTLQRHSGRFLSEGYEGRHQFSLAELMAPLEAATRAADELASLGLPLPEFTSESIEWALGSLAFAPLLPTLVSQQQEAPGATGTLSPDSIGDLSPAARFVMLVYPLIAGRRFPLPALYTPSAYITIPNISESSNRHLMEWASSEHLKNPSLSSLLTTLLASEGLKEHNILSLASRQAGHSNTPGHTSPPPPGQSQFPPSQAVPPPFPTTPQPYHPSQQPTQHLAPGSYTTSPPPQSYPSQQNPYPTSQPGHQSHYPTAHPGQHGTQFPSHAAPPPQPGQFPSHHPTSHSPHPSYHSQAPLAHPSHGSVVPAAPAPPPMPGASAPPTGDTPATEKSLPARRKSLPLVLTLAALLALTAGASYYYFQHYRNQDTVTAANAAPADSGESSPGTPSDQPTNLPAPGDSEKTALQNEIKALFFKKERSGELSSRLDRYTSLYGNDDSFAQEAKNHLARMLSQADQAIKVPGDAPDLATAMRQAVAGQSIELAPGTHSAQVICKPGIRLIGANKSTTIIEMSDASASALQIREGDTVVLENLTIQARRKSGNSPALVTVIGGSLDARDSQFLNNGGDALHVLSGGRLTLSNCEIHHNDGNGVHLVSHSRAQLTKVNFHHNAKSGIRAAAAEVSLELSDCQANDNTLSGLEAEGGAKITIKGGEFQGNLEAGLNLSGQDTRLTASGASFNKNKVGVVSENRSHLSLSQCHLTENRETGLRYLKGAIGSRIKSSQIQRNGIFGVMIEGNGQKPAEATLFLEKCRLQDNGNVALAATEAAWISIGQESELLNNGIALLSASQAQIDIAESLLRYRPSAGQEGLIREGGKISEIGLEIDEVN
ncbi:MAG: protein kinase domain-containing protein [Verrucomicrobiales bacterium]